MPGQELDDVDRGILYLLQENAREHTTTAIGDRVGVSASTVSNRIEKLKESGVVTGFHPIVDYAETGLEHHLQLHCTAPFEDRDALADEVMGISGVVSVRELVTTQGNLTVEIVGRDRPEIESTLEAIRDIDVRIGDIDLVKGERRRPYNHFGEQFTEGADAVNDPE